MKSLQELLILHKITQAPNLEEINQKLADELYPELKNSPKLQYQIRRADGLEVLRNYNNAIWGFFTSEGTKLEKKIEEQRKKIEAQQREIEALKVETTQLKSEIATAREGRGVYENTRLTALEQENRTLKNQLDDCHVNAARVIAQNGELKNIITGKDVAIEASQRDIGQLTKVMNEFTSSRNQAAKSCTALLRAAREKIEDRWPNMPYAKLILDDIDAAIKAIA